MGLESPVSGLLTHSFGKYLIVILSFPLSLKTISGVAGLSNLRITSSIFQALHCIGPLHYKSLKNLRNPYGDHINVSFLTFQFELTSHTSLLPLLP